MVLEGHKAARESIFRLPPRPDADAGAADQSTDVRTVEPDQTDRALGLILDDNPDDPRAAQHKVSGFRDVARMNGYDLKLMTVGFRGGDMTNACLFVPYAGGTALVFASRPHRRPAEADDDPAGLAAATLERACQWAFQSDATLLQALTHPADDDRRELFERCRFRFLTNLIYMARAAQPDTPAPDLPTDLTWLSYQPAHHELFQRTITGTYRDSLDCPELENLRTMEQVIEGHQAAGEFDPRLWQLLLRREEPVGVLLLAPVASAGTMDLTYMGLLPSARRSGLGELLLQEALYRTAAADVPSITLAVDCRNQPAYRRYERLGFEELLQRSALIRSARW